VKKNHEALWLAVTIGSAGGEVRTGRLEGPLLTDGMSFQSNCDILEFSPP
jgi:hypothetical protein